MKCCYFYMKNIIKITPFNLSLFYKSWVFMRKINLNVVEIFLEQKKYYLTPTLSILTLFLLKRKKNDSHIKIKCDYARIIHISRNFAELFVQTDGSNYVILNLWLYTRRLGTLSRPGSHGTEYCVIECLNET